MQVYRTFKGPAPPLDHKIARFMSRTSGLDVQQLATKLAKDYTIAMLEELKAKHLPYEAEVRSGTKVNRARELAEFLLASRKEYRV